MKVYTDYGPFEFKALESCVMEVEDVREWILISTALEKKLKADEEWLNRCKSYGDVDLSETEKNIDILKKLISELESKNTIHINTFNIKKVTKSLWHK